jgi:hypothetical protein
METIYYHGSKDGKIRNIGDFKPIFFTKNKEYAEGYGIIGKYHLNIENTFDVRNYKDLEVYNGDFIPYALKMSKNDTKRYKKISDNMVDFSTADLLWVFLRKRKRDGIYNYDSLIVDEFGDGTELSFVPLNYNQITNVNELNERCCLNSVKITLRNFIKTEIEKKI